MADENKIVTKNDELKKIDKTTISAVLEPGNVKTNITVNFLPNRVNKFVVQNYILEIYSNERPMIRPNQLKLEVVSDEELSNDFENDTEAYDSENDAETNGSKNDPMEGLSCEIQPIEPSIMKSIQLKIEAVSDEEMVNDSDNDSEELFNENSTENFNLIRKRKVIDEQVDPSNIENESELAKKNKVGESSTTGILSQKLISLWEVVEEDPSDFAGWLDLIQYVDQKDNVKNAREVYCKFLQLYPYCYCYWRKFADFEKRNNNIIQCEEVMKRGLNTIPLSIDLWVYYTTYLQNYHTNNVHLIRNAFENCLKQCGLEYHSDQLWENYINWEIYQNELTNAFNVYNRLIATPISEYLKHFINFKAFVNTNPPDKILSPYEFHKLRRKVTVVLRLTNDSTPLGEEEHLMSSPMKETELTFIKECIIKQRHIVHVKTADEVVKRKHFEENIKRRYFHLQNLNNLEIENWKNYIEFEKNIGDHQRIIILYERCLIVCASYKEFWLNYLYYLESLQWDVSDLLNNLFTRACLVHHRDATELHLKWSIFEENKDNLDKAVEILDNFIKFIPHKLEIIHRRINLEKRKESYDKVCDLYNRFINIVHTQCFRSSIALKYSNFLANANEIDKAIEVLERVINIDISNINDNKELWLELIRLNISLKPFNKKSIIQIYDKILALHHLNLELKIYFAKQKFEFIDDYISDSVLLNKAYNDFIHYSKTLDKEKIAENAREAISFQTNQELEMTSSPSNPHTVRHMPGCYLQLQSTPAFSTQQRFCPEHYSQQQLIEGYYNRFRYLTEQNLPIPQQYEYHLNDQMANDIHNLRWYNHTNVRD